MTLEHRTIAPTVVIVCLFAAQAPGWEGETPEWMPGGNLMTELRASGINVGFVPGDAFFPVQIDDSLSFKDAVPYFTDGMATWGHEKELSDNPKGNFIEYDYHYPAMVKTHQPVWLGFGRIRIVNMTEEDADILREFYDGVFFEQEEISSDEGRPYMWGDIEGKPQIAIVIVNRDFDLKNHRPYVRYNEHWNDYKPKYQLERSYFTLSPYGHPSDQAWPRHYRPHLLTAEAVLEDWQNGPQVAPLKVLLPESLDLAKTYKESLTTENPWKIEAPVEMDFREAAFVGYPTADLQRIFTRPLNSTFYVATYEGVYRYRWDYSTKEVERQLVKEVVYERGQSD